VAYFHSHFRLVRHMNTYSLYARHGPPSPPAAR
jgi:hypothetical protein